MSKSGTIPTSWARVRLDSVAFVQTGIAKGKAVHEPSIELPYLRVANVQAGYLNLNEIKTIELPTRLVTRYQLKQGDVLLTEGGDFDKLGRGTVWNSQIECCLHQNHVFAVRPNHNVLSSEFLSYLTGSEYGRRYFLSCAKQTTNLASINSSQLKAFPVLLPSIEEQKRIVAVLKQADTAIDLTEQLIAAKQQRKKGLMQRLLTGQVRFPGFDGAWEKVNLGKIAIEHDGIKTGPFGSQLHASEYVEKGVPVVMPKDLVNLRVSHRTIAQVSQDKADKLSHQLLQEGDIIFGRRGEIGRCALITEDDLPSLCGTGCLRFRPTSSIDSSFIAYLLRLPKTIAWLNRNAVGQTMLNLNSSILRDLPLDIPELAEQKLIGDFFEKVDSEIQLLQQKRDLLQQQKKGLMQQLLTGKVRVPV